MFILEKMKYLDRFKTCQKILRSNLSIISQKVIKENIVIIIDQNIVISYNFKNKCNITIDEFPCHIFDLERLFALEKRQRIIGILSHMQIVLKSNFKEDYFNNFDLKSFDLQLAHLFWQNKNQQTVNISNKKYPKITALETYYSLRLKNAIYFEDVIIDRGYMFFKKLNESTMHNSYISIPNLVFSFSAHEKFEFLNYYDFS